MTTPTTEDFTREPDAMKAVLQALAPLEQEERARVITFVVSKMKISNTPHTSQVRTGTSQMAVMLPPASGADLSVTPKVFLAQKKPLNAVERVACLGYFLAHHRGLTKFRNEDLMNLNDEAAQPRIGNIAQTVKNAIVQSGYLAADGEGLRQISARGEAIVQALPDREGVKAAQAEFPGGRKRNGSRKASKDE